MSHSINLSTDVIGNITHIDNDINSFTKYLNKAKDNLEETKRQLEIAKENIKEPFFREEEFKAKTSSLKRA